MATIETRQTPDGKISYRVKIRVRGFPSQSATFERKTDARNWASQAGSKTRTLYRYPILCRYALSVLIVKSAEAFLPVSCRRKASAR